MVKEANINQGFSTEDKTKHRRWCIIYLILDVLMVCNILGCAGMLTWLYEDTPEFLDSFHKITWEQVQWTAIISIIIGLSIGLIILFFVKYLKHRNILQGK